jgi:predicted RNase H-like HicB family nuclease
VYRIGCPGWKLLALLGAELRFKVLVHRDEQSNSFWATSPDIDGLVVTGNTLDDLHQEVTTAAAALLELQLRKPPRRAIPDFRMP